MGFGAKISDRERLSRLLQYATLTDSERSVFQGWYDDLTAKVRDELSPRERLWVEGVYEERDVGRRRADARKKMRAVVQAENDSPRFAPLALPKRPPGR